MGFAQLYPSYDYWRGGPGRLSGDAIFYGRVYHPSAPCGVQRRTTPETEKLMQLMYFTEQPMSA